MVHPGNPPRRFALKIGYLSEGLFGYAQQPGKPTVESLLVSGIERQGLALANHRLPIASRTDRGVHALGNVIALEGGRISGVGLVGMLNSIDDRVFCFGYAPVPPEFNLRKARQRWYRYLLPLHGRDPEDLYSVLEEFVGHHDFTSFSRKDAVPRGTERELTSVGLSLQGDLARIDLVAPSFLWGMVRKIVASSLLVVDRKLTRRELREALNGGRTLTLPLAPPEGLVLMDVDYGFPFSPASAGRKGRGVALDRIREEVSLRSTLLGWFSERVRVGSPSPSVVTGCSLSQESPST